MRRGAKPAKAKREAKLPVARKSPKNEGARIRDLEKRLAEALEQQTATAEILRVIASSPTDLQPVFDVIVQSAARLCDGLGAGLFRFDGELIHFAALHNVTPEVIEEVRRIFPVRPTRAFGSGRAILSRAVVHIPDVEVDPEFALQAQSRAVGYRSGLWAPMMREGTPIGVVAVVRAQPRLFPDAQIELLKTFAAQAVIAIENVRLFTELQEKNRALTEAHAQVTESLEQQTATADILRVIASSPTDLQPVMDAVAASAARLCGATDAAVRRVHGDFLETVAVHGPAWIDRIPVQRDVPSGRAVIDAVPIHVHDVVAAQDEFPGLPAQVLERGGETLLAVPLLREGVAIGVISIRRHKALPFTEKQIALLQTFANQAVIAIENVRLFTELEARNREVTETLEQQTATAEILRVISSSPTDLQPVMEAIAENAARVCGAMDSGVFLLEGELGSAVLRRVSRRGSLIRGVPVGESISVNRDRVGGRVVFDRRTIHVEDIRAAEAEFPVTVSSLRQRGSDIRTMVATPLLREGTPLGVIYVNRGPEPNPFSAKQIALLETFANQAVIAIENVRLFTELQEKNRALTAAHAQISETLEQRTATAEILQVISRSPTDVQPVFDTIVRSAVPLCDAVRSNVQLFDGELMHWVAQHNVRSEVMDLIHRLYPMQPDRSQTASRAVLTRSVVHLPDVLDDHEYRRELALSGGWRSMLSVPMIRAGDPIGAITVVRDEPGRFSETQIALLQTFANQAVIAIENVRLFTELQEKNQALTDAHAHVTESLEQQTATSEILRVISGSPTDAQPVFDAILESAVRLCSATVAGVYRFDGAQLEQVAAHNSGPGMGVAGEVFGRAPSRDTVAGLTVLGNRVIHIENAPRAGLSSLRRFAELLNFCGILGVPMLRDGLPIGSIVVAHSEVGFSSKQIELLKTFADQAVIAIENVRLFTELEGKNLALTKAHAQVTEALDQQTATSEILRVISSSPTDLQPVMDVVAESAARFCGATDATIWRLEGESLRFVAVHGTQPATTPIGGMIAVTPGSVTGRVVLDRQTIHVEDIQASDTEFPETQERVRLVHAPTRTLLATPLLREDVPIGVIVLRKREVQPFTAKQIELVEDLRRPGGHRHRERAPVQGTRSPDPGPDALGGRASGARRCRPGAQFDTRSGHGAPDHRDARQPAGRWRRVLRLRVRRGDRNLPPPRDPQP